MTRIDHIAALNARARYVRTLERFVGPCLRFRVRGADNDNRLPLGAA